VIIKNKVFAQEQAFDVVAVYKVAAICKIIEGDGISIYSHTNRLNIKAIRKVFKGAIKKVFKGEDVIK
jgi:hypothetical protein